MNSNLSGMLVPGNGLLHDRSWSVAAEIQGHSIELFLASRGLRPGTLAQQWQLRAGIEGRRARWMGGPSQVLAELQAHSLCVVSISIHRSGRCCSSRNERDSCVSSPAQAAHQAQPSGGRVREDGGMDLTFWWDCLAAMKRPSHGWTGLVSLAVLWESCGRRAGMPWA